MRVSAVEPSAFFDEEWKMTVLSRTVLLWTSVSSRAFLHFYQDSLQCSASSCLRGSGRTKHLGGNLTWYSSAIILTTDDLDACSFRSRSLESGSIISKPEARPSGRIGAGLMMSSEEY